jgi:hypothetical protein
MEANTAVFALVFGLKLKIPVFSEPDEPKNKAREPLL